MNRSDVLKRHQVSEAPEDESVCFIGRVEPWGLMTEQSLFDRMAARVRLTENLEIIGDSTHIGRPVT